jgi:mono/diheme cytochrome c family protein
VRTGERCKPLPGLRVDRSDLMKLNQIKPDLLIEPDLPIKRDLDVIKLNLNRIALLAAVVAASLTSAVPASAQSAATAPGNAPLDVEQLFASTCGWCHSDGGRAAGKGPQLMDSPRTDDFLRNRIKMGKPGAMPAFGETFNDAQIDQIIAYIRALKPK